MDRINMDKGTKLTLHSEINGSVSISNEDTQITIHADGTIAISSAAPIQFTGASLAKLDKCSRNLDAAKVKEVLAALETRLDKNNN